MRNQEVLFNGWVLFVVKISIIASTNFSINPPERQFRVNLLIDQKKSI